MASILHDTVSLLIWSHYKDNYVAYCEDEEMRMPRKCISNDYLTDDGSVLTAAKQLLEEMQLADFKHMKIICDWRHIFPNGSGFQKFSLSHTCVLVVCDTVTLNRRQNGPLYEWISRNTLEAAQTRSNEFVQAIAYFTSASFNVYRNTLSPNDLSDVKVRAVVSGPYNYEPVEYHESDCDFFKPRLPQAAMEAPNGAHNGSTLLDRIVRETRVTKMDEHALHIQFLLASWPSFTLNFKKFKRLFDWSSTLPVPGESTPAELREHIKRLFRAIEFMGQSENSLVASSSSAYRYKRYLTFSDLLMAFTCCQSTSIGRYAAERRALATFAYYAHERSGNLKFEGLLMFVRHAEQKKGGKGNEQSHLALAKDIAKRIVTSWDLNNMTWSINSSIFLDSRRQAACRLPDYRLLIGDAMANILSSNWLQLRVSPAVFTSLENNTEAVLLQYCETLRFNDELIKTISALHRDIQNELLCRDIQNVATAPFQPETTAAVGNSLTMLHRSDSTLQSTPTPTTISWDCPPVVISLLRNTLALLGTFVRDWTVQLAQLRQMMKSPQRYSVPFDCILQHPESTNHNLSQSSFLMGNDHLQTDQRTTVTPVERTLDVYDSHADASPNPNPLSYSLQSIVPVSIGREQQISGSSIGQGASVMQLPTRTCQLGDMSRVQTSTSQLEEVEDIANRVDVNSGLVDVVSLFICCKSGPVPLFALCHYSRGWYLPYRALEEQSNQNGELPTKVKAVNDTAGIILDELFPAEVRSSLQLHGVVHYWHKLLPPMGNGFETRRWLTHYCVLVTIESTNYFPAQLDALNRQPLLRWVSADQIDKWFKAKSLLGDEVKQLVVEWHDYQFQAFRSTWKSEDMPFSGFSFASSTAYHENQLESPELCFLYERIIGEMNVTRADEIALYLKYTKITWPSLSMNLITFERFTRLQEVCPYRPIRRVQDFDDRLAYKRFYESLCLNRPYYLHYPLLLLGLSVLQAPSQVAAPARSAGERRARYMFYFYDKDCDGLLNFDEFRDIVIDTAMENSLHETYATLWNADQDNPERSTVVTEAIIRQIFATDAQRQGSQFKPDRQTIDMEKFLRSRRLFLKDYRVRMRKSLQEILQDDLNPAVDRLINFPDRLVDHSAGAELSDVERATKILDLIRDLENAAISFRDFETAHRESGVSNFIIGFSDGIIHYVLTTIKFISSEVESFKLANTVSNSCPELFNFTTV